MGRVGGGAKTNPPESFVTRNYLSPSSFSLSKIARFGEFQECCELQGQTQPVMVSASPTRRISTNREVRVPRFEDHLLGVERFVSSQISRCHERLQ